MEAEISCVKLKIYKITLKFMEFLKIIIQAIRLHIQNYFWGASSNYVSEYT